MEVFGLKTWYMKHWSIEGIRIRNFVESCSGISPFFVRICGSGIFWEIFSAWTCKRSWWKKCLELNPNHVSTLTNGDGLALTLNKIGKYVCPQRPVWQNNWVFLFGIPRKESQPQLSSFTTNNEGCSVISLLFIWIATPCNTHWPPLITQNGQNKLKSYARSSRRLKLNLYFAKSLNIVVFTKRNSFLATQSARSCGQKAHYRKCTSHVHRAMSFVSDGLSYLGLVRTHFR